MQNLGMSEEEIIGGIVVIAVCIFICLISFIKQRMSLLAGCLIRMGSGTGMILLANYVFKISGVSLFVGVGPVSLLTSAILGIPGVCLLYSILLL
jgi:hypothetical protein